MRRQELQAAKIRFPALFEWEQAGEEAVHVISLGAGVQSSTMALMASEGLIGPMPAAAIFADTGWEPKAVYEWLVWLETKLAFPVHRVTAGNLRDDLLMAAREKTRFASVPYFTESGGMSRRNCTKDYKLMPVRRKAREIMRDAGAKRMVQWVGISTDEITRMKPSGVKYIGTRWPLLEMDISRHDCEAWLLRNYGVVAPRSACLGCPFHSDAEWRRIRDETPQEWAETIAVDAEMRAHGPRRAMKDLEFMHFSRVPLSEVDLSTAADKGQLDMFANECEGMCGV